MADEIKKDVSVVTKKISVSHLDLNNKPVNTELPKNTLLVFSKEDSGYVVKDAMEDESHPLHAVVVDVATFKALRGVNCIINKDTQNSIDKAGEGNSIELENKVIELTKTLSEKEELIEELENKVKELNSTVEALTVAGSSTTTSKTNKTTKTNKTPASDLETE